MNDNDMTLEEMHLAAELDNADKTHTPDTHGVDAEGWYGFDLDGTLAEYHGWKGIDHIGKPVRPMVELIKKFHRQGRRVKIMTARIAPRKLEDGTMGEQYIIVPEKCGGATRQYAHQYINDWCHFNLGFVPETVYTKDHLMLELYDDRVKQVEPNTGLVIEKELEKCKTALGNALGKTRAEIDAFLSACVAEGV